jgi:hypothetical protein
VPAGTVTAAGPTGTTSGTAPAAGQVSALVRVLFRIDGGDDDLKRLIRNWVSVDGGGDVQLAFGQ